MANWYTRPVFAVRDAHKALHFYTAKLGFHEEWRYEEDDRLRIVEVARQGCQLILSDQWPEEAGRGLVFISLDYDDFEEMKTELHHRGVDLKSGQWGYELIIVEDPDGNRLWFPKPEPTPTSHSILEEED